MRILFIAEPASIHAARWISQCKGTGWDIHISSGTINSSHICDDFNFGTIHHSSSEVTPQGAARGLTAAKNQQELIVSLAHLIDSLQPDLVHILGLCVNFENRASAIVEAYKKRTSKKNIPLIYSSWGTDFDYFASLSQHSTGVKEVVPHFDYHISECDRDIRLARNFGFKGITLEKLPAFGGTTWEHTSFPFIPTSQRQIIFLKARDEIDSDPIGKAMTAIKSLLLCHQHFTGKMIGLFQSGSKLTHLAELTRQITNIDIKAAPRFPHHRNILEAMSQSCAFVAITKNDGLPSSLVEAMSLGAIPIHSNLEPIREWITNGENGLLVEPDDVVGTARAFKKALTDKAFIEHAARKNMAIVAEKLSERVVKPRVLKLYESLCS